MENLQPRPFKGCVPSHPCGRFHSNGKSDPLTTAGWTTVDRCPASYLDTSSQRLDEWSCSDCPEGASCEGDVIWSDVVALEGWWRSKPLDDTLMECFIPRACLGSDAEAVDMKKYNRSGAAEINANTQEACNEAIGYRQSCIDYHTGENVRCRLCASCMKGYKRGKLRGECERCFPSATRAALWPLGIFLLVSAVAALVLLSVRARRRHEQCHQKDTPQFCATRRIGSAASRHRMAAGSWSHVFCARYLLIVARLVQSRL